jgi:hypothetical protein
MQPRPRECGLARQCRWRRAARRTGVGTEDEPVIGIRMIGNRLRRTIVAAAVLLLGGPIAFDHPAEAQNPYVFDAPVKKLALVIGNGTYANQPPLPGAMLDVERVADTLSALGFVVHKYTDLGTRKNFTNALQSFKLEVDTNSLIVFYYSGHGLSYGGENYLLPLQTPAIVPAKQVGDTFVGMTEIRSFLQDAQPALLMMMFDACRSLSNIIDSTTTPGKIQAKGLSMPSGAGDALIWFASDLGYESYMPDATKSSFYTEALVKRLPNAGDEIDQVRKWIVLDVRKATEQKQSPWSSESSAAEVWFNPSAKTKQDLLQIWQATLASQDPDAIGDFVLRYGTSPYAAGARKWLEDHPAAQPATSSISPQAIEARWENSQPHPATADVTAAAAAPLPIDIESLRSDRALAAPQTHVVGPTSGTKAQAASPHVFEGTTPQIVVRTPIEANEAKSSSSAKVTVPAGTRLEVTAAARPRTAADNNWLEVKNPRSAGSLFIPLNPTTGSPRTIDVGQPLLERTAPIPGSAPLAMVDPAFVRQAVADARGQGRSISWVSISTPLAEKRSDTSLFLLRAQQAASLLVQQGVPRQQITIVEAGARGEANIRLRFFGQ